MSRITAVAIAGVSLVGSLAAQTPAAQPPDAPRPPRPRTTGRTAYTASSELFATVPGLVAGQPGRVGVHLSHLGERFTPYTVGTVTATLVVDGSASTRTVDKPARPGVWRVELTPATAGTGTLTVDVAGADGTDRFAFENVTVYPDVATALAQQGADPEAGAIKYTKEHSWDENEYASAVVGRVRVGAKSGARPVPAVPRSAVVDVDGKSMVYVQRNPEVFDLKEVTTGAANAEWVEITSGVRDGERVVIKGGPKMPRR